MSNHSMIRITKELSGIQKGSDLSIAVACRDVDVRNVKAIIIGPSDTPYEFGFFEIDPRDSTWRGESGEEWSSAQGLESILISIQSLMSSNPYENEPGFEDLKEPQDKKNQKDYVDKIRHETIRISVIQKLEEYLGILPNGVWVNENLASSRSVTPDAIDDLDTTGDESSVAWFPFKDFCKRRFIWYYDSYLLAISKAKEGVKDGQQFIRMPFEGQGNDMSGKFNYGELERRLKTIKTVLDKETQRWPAEALTAKTKDTGVWVNLQRQYEQVVEAYKRDPSKTLDIELVDKNPFEWSITIFGRPMTNLDGGLFIVKLYFSPRFPEEQPRARFETQLFHHRIATDGTPCYTATRVEDVKSHVDAILEALEEESPPYDPRTMVNPEAAKMYWGSPDDRKNYNRKLRRAVQRSTE
ncbi:MAG: hypothetical protein M1818_008261 [Claussenomyces sp. TS43310]|nr:MAG: hypothetical protein M1818_008261 [Claussenomyces sp. TS43310]